MLDISQADRRFESCRRCGACCASYRITLPLIELKSRGGSVPDEITTPYTRTTACLREAPDMPGRCAALIGEIGKEVACAIYADRPAACRDFAPLAALGQWDEACEAARNRFKVSGR